jgi:hypothetical protein
MGFDVNFGGTVLAHGKRAVRSGLNLSKPPQVAGRCSTAGCPLQPKIVRARTPRPRSLAGCWKVAWGAATRQLKFNRLKVKPTASPTFADLG